MITENPNVVLHFVEAQHHRINRFIFEGFNKVALNGVARINQNYVRLLLADGFHLGGNLAQAAT
ncbi:Uncharacterised protein [Vibrio cholerae]|nr:Uncharacterised protein [Vibrio cholerae]CSB38460.1 Uncharacterised protein [Vibrio cholerae]